MNLSENFTLNELTYSSTAISNNIKNNPSKDEIENLRSLCVNILQKIRDKYNNPIHITSGYRSPILNRLIGGVPTSYHTSGNAADIYTTDKKENKKLFDLIVGMIENKEITVGELINEKKYEWIHISNPVREINEIIR